MATRLMTRTGVLCRQENGSTGHLRPLASIMPSDPGGHTSSSTNVCGGFNQRSGRIPIAGHRITSRSFNAIEVTSSHIEGKTLADPTDLDDEMTDLYKIIIIARSTRGAGRNEEEVRLWSGWPSGKPERVLQLPLHSPGLASMLCVRMEERPEKLWPNHVYCPMCGTQTASPWICSALSNV
jgi:hypothetical protein